MTRKPLISLILLILATPTLAEMDAQAFIQCGKVKAPDQRLHCFDQALALLKRQSFQPPPAFMQSELRTREDKSEYALTVRDFLELLASARPKEKQRITLLGWEQEQERFRLGAIINDSRVDLEFRFHAPRKFSVLQPVNYMGETIAASQFILVVAAMTPL